MEVTMSAALAVRLPDVDPVMDPESRAWVAALAGDGADREAALERLHALLLRRPGSSWAAAAASWPACRRPNAPTWPSRPPTTR
jgi:hypothetical protein